MGKEDPKLSVYYDAACPRCVRDRRRYEKLAGPAAGAVRWIDVNACADLLRRKGIDPREAILALHVEDEQGRIHRELDAYVLLMDRVLRLKPLGWLIRLPGLRALISWAYRKAVRRRLRRQGRDWTQAP